MTASEPRAAAATTPAVRAPPAAQPPRGSEDGSTFPRFADLPAELRLKIWHHSFLPRVITLHTRKLHYADDSRNRGVPSWQSRNANPAQLSVSVEARQAAQEHYSVSLPLAVERTCERAGESPLDRHRRLFLSPRADVVAVLGELNVVRVQLLLRYLQQQDPRRRGLRRLGVSAGCFAHQGGGRSLRVYAKTIFRGLDELVLFMYNERMPPDSWPDGGECDLSDCRTTDYYRRFVLGRGAELRDGDGWVRVGGRNAELQVADLVFRSQETSCTGREAEISVEMERLKVMYPDAETDVLSTLLADL